MDIINPNAAGIDIGSHSHFVAINQEHSDVRESYWQNLFTELQNSEIEVILTNGKFTKDIKGKKTDVLDCMWI